MCALPHFQYANCSLGFVWYGESRLLYCLIREIKMWLNINHITLHSNAYCGWGVGGCSCGQHFCSLKQPSVFRVSYFVVKHNAFTL